VAGGAQQLGPTTACLARRWLRVDAYECVFLVRLGGVTPHSPHAGSVIAVVTLQDLALVGDVAQYSGQGSREALASRRR
ncbi:MAG: hypothetical protein P8X82_08205, partial [Gemmatimonadales bacterium]